MLIKVINADNNKDYKNPCDLPVLKIDRENKKVIIGFNPNEDHTLNTATDEFNGETAEILNDNICVFKGNYYRIAYIKWGVEQKILFTLLISYQSSTYICQCNECGKIYVIEPSEIYWYTQKGYVLPDVRCPECRKKKKERFKTA
jgi:hypothetical protein